MTDTEEEEHKTIMARDGSNNIYPVIMERNGGFILPPIEHIRYYRGADGRIYRDMTNEEKHRARARAQQAERTRNARTIKSLREENERLRKELSKVR